ncbi:hypothetical protein K492DRAFT_174761 [Lichtheimia hyalospora FSU 10163]|nr:hypothetical protein K492DRAFT_174761 [Lichtheimia hyalospora FSU 10163]
MPASKDNASARMLLKDLFNTSTSVAESFLGQLTPEQIHLIEDTINRIKRRKVDKQDDVTTVAPLPTPAPSPGPSSPSNSDISDRDNGATTTTTTTPTPTSSNTATAIASALASAMACAALANNNNSNNNANGNSKNEGVATIAPSTNDSHGQHDMVAEMRDGVEWVSFVYSHNRTLRRYNIRTDIQNVSLDAIDIKFKEENCVYPRANLPREQYQGNRWNYETECNVLGWKLAWLNSSEISGKRGLIQRAVDSYRNRYPSMRSRRVARQEKLMNGTLRKRKHREENDQHSTTATPLATVVSAQQQQSSTTSSTLSAAIVKPAHQPKTIVLDENGTRIRIKVNVESVNMDEIPAEFRKSNCVFPRAINMYAGARWLEESLCNELGWRLAWLNQRQLAGKKSLLQRALDAFRKRFMPSLQPRKQSTRVTSPMSLSIDTNTSNNAKPMPLTAAALSAQNAWYEQQEQQQTTTTTESVVKGSPAPSCASGTTITLDFGDCFSLADDDDDDNEQHKGDNECCDKQLCSCGDELSTIMSSSTACTPSPTSNIFGFPPEVDLYDSFTLPPATDMSHFMDIDSKPSTTASSNNISSNTTLTASLKLPDTILASPSLPSSAVDQQDLVVKMEQDDMILLPSFPTDECQVDAERFFFDLF